MTMELNDNELALIVKVRKMRAHHSRSNEIWRELLNALSDATSADNLKENPDFQPPPNTPDTRK